MIWGLNNYRQCFRASSRYAATLPGYGSIEPVYEKKPSVYQKNSCGLWMWNPNQKLLVMGKKIHPQMRKWVLSMKSWTSSSSDMFQSKPLKVTSPDLGPLISPCRSDFFSRPYPSKSHENQKSHHGQLEYIAGFGRVNLLCSRCSGSGDADPVIFRSFQHIWMVRPGCFSGRRQQTWWLDVVRIP